VDFVDVVTSGTVRDDVARGCRAGLSGVRRAREPNRDPGVAGDGANASVAASVVAGGSQMHEVPMLHVPVPVDGQLEKSHAWPHAPQLNGSVWMFTQWLSQAVWSGDVQVKHDPPVQMSFVPQTLPHAPQFEGSESRSTQVSPHRV